jgi:hypothetical protein
MRVQQLTGPDAELQREWCDYLLRIGEGREPGCSADKPDFVRLPPDVCMPTALPSDLIQAVFGDLSRPDIDPRLFTSNCILTPKNDAVDMLNAEAMGNFPGAARTYQSADRPIEVDQAAIYPTEFLNTLTPQGLPPHELTLKVGCPIMLLRNFNSRLGLANGTRLIVRKLDNWVIQAQVITGTNVGAIVLIPRIPLISNDPHMPIKFRRLQVPVRLAFAMTINKAQGQTMERVGLYLPGAVFGHGQLYVALSRVTQRRNLMVMVGHDLAIQNHSLGLCTANIVYREVL